MTQLTPQEAKADALARFTDPGPDHINCSQAIVRFAVLVLDLDADLVTVARYFGGGIAGMGEVCGAVSGAAMALGMRDMDLAVESPELRPRTTEQLRELLRGFAGEFGCRRCLDLSGFDLSTPEGHDAFAASDARERCAGYVGWMCDRLAPLLAET